LLAVEDFEALLHVFHANAGAVAADAGVGTVAHADAIVGNFDDDAIALEFAAQGDGATVDARLESVLDGVFDQGLKKNAGDEHVEGVGIDLFFDAELFNAEADDFDVEIIIGEA